jgi:hypothetical protein
MAQSDIVALSVKSDGQAWGNQMRGAMATIGAADLPALPSRFAPVDGFRPAGAAPGATVSTRAAMACVPQLLTIPTYEGSGVAVHPSVVFVPNKWNGYHYWMAFTPYPSQDNQVEDPSIVASNDGVTWVVPEGLTNPIEPSPGGSNDYNSDTHLILASDGHLYCFWRSVDGTFPGAEERIYYRRSPDGVAWSDRVLVVAHNVTVSRPVSPAVIEEPDGTWRMFAVDIIPSPNKVVVFTATSLEGPWTRTDTTGVGYGSGRDPWHLDAHLIDGEYVVLVSDTALNTTASGFLHRSVSVDGVNFTADVFRFPQAKLMYRSCFLPAVVAGSAGYEVYFGTIDEIRRGFVSLNPSYRWQDDPTLMLAAAERVAPYTLGDLVNRADSAVTPGTATSGQTWTVEAGTMGVSSNAIYGTSTVNQRCVIEAGLADGEFGFTFKVSPSTSEQGWLVFRSADANNFWRFGAAGTVLHVQKVVAGTLTTAATFLGVQVPGRPGVRLKVRCRGDQITAFVDDMPLGTVNDATHSSATKIGLNVQNANVRFTSIFAYGLS